VIDYPKLHSDLLLSQEEASFSHLLELLLRPNLFHLDLPNSFRNPKIRRLVVNLGLNRMGLGGEELRLIMVGIVSDERED